MAARPMTKTKLVANPRRIPARVKAAHRRAEDDGEERGDDHAGR